MVFSDARTRKASIIQRARTARNAPIGQAATALPANQFSSLCNCSSTFRQQRARNRAELLSDHGTVARRPHTLKLKPRRRSNQQKAKTVLRLPDLEFAKTNFCSDTSRSRRQSDTWALSSGSGRRSTTASGSSRRPEMAEGPVRRVLVLLWKTPCVVQTRLELRKNGS